MASTFMDWTNNGEILVVVDLFTRVAILIFLRNRNQDNVAKALIKKIVFQRGVPASLRTNNAPEFSSITGAVLATCKYLNINQIRTGGHNPRGNAICERVNQSLGAMIRKLNDYEYGQLEQLSLPAFQFALSTTYDSAIGCTRSKQAMDSMPLQFHRHASWPLRQASLLRGGRDGGALEDVDEFFDKNIVKDIPIWASYAYGGGYEHYIGMASAYDGRESLPNRLSGGSNIGAGHCTVHEIVVQRFVFEYRDGSC